MSPGPRNDQAVHVVDDDAGVQILLDSLLRSVGYACHVFGSVADFMASGRAGNPGCVILDVRLPGLSGLDFQDQLRAMGVTMPVILMTGHGDIPMSVRGMKAGAIDFLPKPFNEQAMLDAVAAAFRRDAADRQTRAETDRWRTLADSLSGRERAVMRQVAAGRMNKQIAFDLGLSEITVKVHRGHAMRKVGARSLTDFIKMAPLLELDR